MHYYAGPLPQANTREHWLFFRPYGKCVFADGRIVLFNRGHQAIFERCPGQTPTVIVGRDNKQNRDDPEQTIFFFHDGTDPRIAARRIDAELLVLGLPPLSPIPSRSVVDTVDRVRTRLLQRFPGVDFYFDHRSSIDGSGRWSGANHIRISWVEGPLEAAVMTAVCGCDDAVDFTLDRRVAAVF